MNASLSSTTAAWRYGWMAMPLAMVGLPLVMQLPGRLAGSGTMSLTSVGIVMLACRLLDAVTDPLLGRWVDRLIAFPVLVSHLGALAGLLLVSGFALLWWLPTRWPLAWLALGLCVTFLALSLLTLWQQALGVTLGRTEEQLSRITAWREGMALPGVMLASILLGRGQATLALVVLSLCLLLGWRWLRSISANQATLDKTALPDAPRMSQAWDLARLYAPWRDAGFRGLWLTWLLSATASAAAATALPFYVAHYLGASQALPYLLLIYFVATAMALPVWLAAVRRWGLSACWSAGMLVAVLVFASVWLISASMPGRVYAFAVVCACTGLAAGAELACPAALLAAWVQARAGHGLASNQTEGREQGGVAFGWWTLAAKLSVALAAAMALGLLQRLGYQAHSLSSAIQPSALWVYGGLPTLLKGLAFLQWTHHLRSLRSPLFASQQKAAEPASPLTTTQGQA